MTKLKVGIIGSGNIGTDLMYKIERSPVLEMSVMVGIDPESDGLKRAKSRGYEIISNGIDGLMERLDLVDIVYDATSAYAHKRNSDLLTAAGKKVIDLTPAAIGPFTVPPVNLKQYINESNVNMVTCGGQATIPIIHAISRVVPVAYAEIVATIASLSAGPGTRANIDEFTSTTSRAIEVVGGAKKGKAIILLNPAEPPIIMRDTVHVLLEHEGDEEAITQSIKEMVVEVQQYVPGYSLKGAPIFEGKKVSVFLEVNGAADYLPAYAGNLDIMTAAAVQVGNEFARHLQGVTR
ncbi:MAG: acetaldehyde dehydrogenase (acetylating) [Solibacillus sp.]